MYELPRLSNNDFQKKFKDFFNSKVFQVSALIIVITLAVVFATGKVSLNTLEKDAFNFLNLQQPAVQQLAEKQPVEKYVSRTAYEQAIINTVKSASPSVVSIIISKDLPVYEQQYVNPFGDIPGFDFSIPEYVQKGTQNQEIGAGSGFIDSQDGLILTNKHVVSDQQAQYTVKTSNGKKYDAKVLALDPVQDLAIVKIKIDKKLPAITLGDSDGIEVGQGAIAIGNSLGQFSNTVSVGVISGLGRTVSASEGGGSLETLEDVIQTDAAINPGNSGGPLLNLNGEVVGINVAMAQGAQSIGFAIPINIAKRDISQVALNNKISYPFLGIRYVLVNDAIKQKNNLSVDYGALISKGPNEESAITKDSAADKAGLKEGDVILEFDGKKITTKSPLSTLIATYSPGDKVTLTILRDGKQVYVDVILRER